MGYRSNVVAYFYVTKNQVFDPEIDPFLHKNGFDRALTLFRVWWENDDLTRALVERFGADVEATDRGVLFSCEHVKWYEGYEGVALFNKVATRFREDFIYNDELDGGVGMNKMFCYEFARIGEELDDNEFETFGVANEYRLHINRIITVD